tara:strand:- start:360 stop:584 length:225 start_codon:yes stop_codon:yes gene_type:complete
MSVIISKKQKCAHCKRKPGMLTVCKYCIGAFCFNCLQVEIHECNNMCDMKESKLILLKEKLESEKCVKEKIQMI